MRSGRENGREAKASPPMQAQQQEQHLIAGHLSAENLEASDRLVELQLLLRRTAGLLRCAEDRSRRARMSGGT